LSWYKKFKSFDVVNELQEFGCDVSVFDSWASKTEVKQEYNISLIESLDSNKYDAVVLAVSHDNFNNIDVENLLNKNAVIYDIKSFFDIKTDGRL